MGSDAAAGSSGKGSGTSASASSSASSSSSGPSSSAQVKKLQQQQDESTQEPVLLGSVRRPTTGARVHALPCSIAHDGPAAVSTFFLPKRVGSQEDGAKGQAQEAAAEAEAAYEGQFRGRILKGVKAALPQGTVGFVARETVLPPELADAAPSAAANRYWALDSEFTDTVLWRHDLAPPSDHCLQQVQDWCTLARAIHEDDEEEQQAAAMMAE